MIALSMVAALLVSGPVEVASDPGVVQPIADRGVVYELQEGSTLSYTTVNADDPDDLTSVTVAIRGKFCRVPSSTRPIYDIRGIRFTGQNSPTPVTVRGNGTYQVRSACTVPERMKMRVAIEGFPQPTDVRVLLDSGDVWVPEGAFPTIIIDLRQALISATQPWYYTMHLIATPRRYVDFSTEVEFTAHSTGSTARIISDGDLLCDTGRIIRTNGQLMRNFGVMPPVPDVGLDAVSRCPWCPAADLTDVADTVRRCVLFSIEYPVWSETLGCWLGDGDVLCECGWICRTNAELIEAFGPITSVEGVGLDALHPTDNSRGFLFSTEVGFWARDENGDQYWVGDGDLLSDQGYVVKTNQELLENFAPLASTESLGLDAVVVLKNGEIYFSVETDFTDAFYGRINEGDLLSDAGYVVARYWELIANFRPDDIVDVGLDAVDLGREQPCATLQPEEAAEAELAPELSTAGSAIRP